jgi:hypothetical protein
MSTHITGAVLTNQTYCFACCIAFCGEPMDLDTEVAHGARDAGCRGRDSVVCEGRGRRDGGRGPPFILTEDCAGLSLVGLLKLWRGSGE